MDVAFHRAARVEEQEDDRSAVQDVEVGDRDRHRHQRRSLRPPVILASDDDRFSCGRRMKSSWLIVRNGYRLPCCATS
ncbi:hypothetical protein [Pilimelia anulata]|uniref:hypothetical protein n=1 Tax=Pilimelia anulata TaxID=53371 RepID=UPI00166851BB|nr:hypothetical protein [Pilimelia anulata]